MSESERRAGYRYQGILIEAARVLSPQFDDAVVYLTGAQVEMLRNVVHYLERRNTYVSEYHDDYYLWPTDADYDDILAIVGDLEETLMGNPNTIWGYKDRYHEIEMDFNASVNDVQNTTPVPSGEVWVVTQVTALNNTSNFDRLLIAAITDAAAEQPFFDKRDPLATIQYFWSGWLPLKEGDFIRSLTYGNTAGDDLYLWVWGYKMDVPT